MHFKLPKKYNDDININDDEFIDVKEYLLDLYGGLSIGNETLGYWMDSNIEYQDTTIEYMILIEKNEFDKNVKPNIENDINKFKKQFKQLEILCYYHEVYST